jgi:hypothetical protein
MGRRREYHWTTVPRGAVAPRSRPRNHRLKPNDRCPCGSGLKFKRCHRGSGALLPPRPINAIKRIGAVWECVRPLFLDTGDPRYPLRRNGSCFFVTYRGDLWGVTARHALDNQPAYDARFLRRTDEKTPRFFRMTEELHPLHHDAHDNAWLDMVLVRSSDPPEDTLVIDLDTTELAPLEDATADDYVRIVGHPDVLGTGIAYPNHDIHISFFSADGKYDGPSESNFLHLARFEDFGKVTNLNGMSGGPAFLVRENVTWWFAGVVVRGSVESKLMRFIDARKIVDTLRWHYDENPTASIDPRKRRPR